MFIKRKLPSYSGDDSKGLIVIHTPQYFMFMEIFLCIKHFSIENKTLVTPKSLKKPFALRYPS